MFGQEPNFKRYYFVRYNEDEPTISIGTLIPRKTALPKKAISYTPASVKQAALVSRPSPYVNSVRILTIALSLVLTLLLSALAMPFIKDSGAAVLAQLNSAFNYGPVVVENPYTKLKTPLNYGVQLTFTQPNFYMDTQSAFVRDAQTFIEVDLDAMQLRFYKDGILHKDFTIESKGAKGSWWETPAGLYKIENKREKSFSNFGQVYLPWAMTFQGNFVIHGEPYDSASETAATDFNIGGVRLSNSHAEELYRLVDVDTPILVYEKSKTGDGFVYEPKVPDLDTPHYLIADVESNTVLASSDFEAVVPIASITKLMTAIVASEHINLDKTVTVRESSLIESMVPRLRYVNSANMYSLMQLLLVESSNEAAEIIAAQIGRDKFIDLMNEKAKTIGLNNTTFVDPSGLGAGNKSSAGDLLGLIQYIYNHRSFIIEITAKQELPSAYIDGQFGELSNFNTVKGLQNFIGGKIGETTAAGQTSVTLHQIKVKGTERVLAIVILGSDSRDDDVKQLLDYAQERFGY